MRRFGRNMIRWQASNDAGGGTPPPPAATAADTSGTSDAQEPKQDAPQAADAGGASELDELRKRLSVVNGEARDHRLQARDQTARADAADKRVQELEAKVQDLTVKLEDATGMVEAANTRIVRMQIGRETGLPDELAERLVGTTEDELRADAQRLAAVARTDGTRNPLAAGHGSAAQGDAGGEMSPTERMSRAYATAKR